MEQYIAKKSVLKYGSPLFICILLCWCIIPIFIALYFIRRAQNEKVIFEGTQYTIEEGVFGKKATNRAITKILSVNVEQSVLGKTFNYGTVYCQTPEGFGASFDYVSNPQGLKEYLEKIRDKEKQATNTTI